MQLPQTTYEQRSEIYADLRKLLRPGFLAHRVVVNGAALVLRSLNENDWVLLQYRVDPNSILDWKRWMVATSVWMVDGQIILGDENARYLTYEMCKHLPSSVLDDLYGVVNALRRRVTEAMERCEAYLYEEEARYLWKTEGSRLVEEGRMGLNDTGLNSVQKLWLYFNHVEDEHVQEQHQWELAKFVVGPHVPKGIKKINAKDKQQKDELKRKRQRACDRIYYEAKGVIPKIKEEEDRKKRWGAWDVRLAETEEELQDEMRRWVGGIKDPHDNIIDFVKSKIKTEVEGRKARAKAQREALSKAMQEEGITKSQLVPLSGTAAHEFIERVKSRVPGVSKVLQDQSHNSAYEKYIRNNPEVGVLEVDEAGNVMSSTSVNPEEMIEWLKKPESGDPQNLQEMIEKRRPTLDNMQKPSPKKEGT